MSGNSVNLDAFERAFITYWKDFGTARHNLTAAIEEYVRLTRPDRADHEQAQGSRDAISPINARRKNDLVELCAEAAQIWKDSADQELPATYIAEHMEAALARVRDEMRPEYDFRGGVRGKYAPRLMTEARRFPIQSRQGLPKSVPWFMVAPHESQAQINHGQSLEVLAERGGLHVIELWALVHHVKSPPDRPVLAWESWLCGINDLRIATVAAELAGEPPRCFCGRVLTCSHPST